MSVHVPHRWATGDSRGSGDHDESSDTIYQMDADEDLELIELQEAEGDDTEETWWHAEDDELDEEWQTFEPLPMRAPEPVFFTDVASMAEHNDVELVLADDIDPATDDRTVGLTVQDYVAELLRLAAGTSSDPFYSV